MAEEESAISKQYSGAYKEAFTCYKEQMHEQLTSHEKGMEPSKLQQLHQSAMTSTRQMYNSLTQKLDQDENLKTQFNSKLAEDMRSYLKNLEILNQKRLDYEKVRPTIERLNAEQQAEVQKADDMLEKLMNGEIESIPSTDVKQPMPTQDIRKAKLALNDDMAQMDRQIKKLQAENRELQKKNNKKHCTIT